MKSYTIIYHDNRNDNECADYVKATNLKAAKDAACEAMKETETAYIYDADDNWCATIHGAKAF